VLGSDDPDVDAEVIDLAWALYRSLGLSQMRLRLTSLGDGVCRPGYRALLVEYLQQHLDELCDEHRDRIEANPLRVLGCTRSGCMRASANAPRMIDHLCDPCREHFARVRADLDAFEVPYDIDPTLVRGLDYYTRTTFEFAALALESAQNAIGGGGRYDGL